MTTNATRPRWRRVFRAGFPQVVVLAAVVALAVIAYGSFDVDRQWLNMARYATLLIAGLLLTLWALFFSGWRKGYVVAVLAVLIAAPVGLLEVHCDGNMGPVVEARPWLQRLALGGTQSDRVRRHREGQAGGPTRADLAVRPGDAPAFRGARRDGIVQGPALDRLWETDPPPLLWKQPCDGGYAGFAEANGFLVTLEQRDDREAVVCYQAATGKEVWSHSWPGHFDEAMGGPGPRSTPTVFEGDVFALGATGHLVCLDGATGAEKWSVDVLRGNANVPWAMSGSPLAYDDLVVVTPGAQTPEAQGRGVIAYRRATGEEVWTAGSHPAGYSSPMLAELGGVRQVLVFDGDGLAGYDPAAGTELWRFPWSNPQHINVAQPVVVDGERVFVATGYGRGGALARVTRKAGAWQAEKVWETKRTVMRCKFTSPVLLEDCAYGLNDGRLECVDLRTGKALWTDDRRPGRGDAYGHGQVLLSGDMLLVLTEFGELVLAEIGPDGFHERGRVDALEGPKTWNTPALAHGRAYVRNAREMACYDLVGRAR